MTTGAAPKPITERDTILASGGDVEQYLQGQLSQDLGALAVGATQWSLVLQPTGRMVALVRVHRRSDREFLLDVDAGHADSLLLRLRRFVLRTDVRFEPVDDSIPESLLWPGLGDPSDERQRILALLPRMGAEITERTIPAEGGRRMIDLAVCFAKGCYTGQELVARINSRGGNVPRPVRVLRADGAVEPMAMVSIDGAEVGRVTSTAGNVALAPLKRSVAIGTTVLVGGVRATVIEPCEP